MAVVDQARLIDMAGLDDSINNTRVRATKSPITVGATTFPSNPFGTNYIDGTGTPVSVTSGTSFTFTAGNLLTGIIVANPTAAITGTFDTAANIVAGVNAVSAGAVVGDYISCLIINGNNTNALTLAAGSGGSYDANQLAAARIVSANASKYCLFRLTNVTSGSEAYVVYS